MQYHIKKVQQSKVHSQHLHRHEMPYILTGFINTVEKEFNA